LTSVVLSRMLTCSLQAVEYHKGAALPGKNLLGHHVPTNLTLVRCVHSACDDCSKRSCSLFSNLENFQLVVVLACFL